MSLWDKYLAPGDLRRRQQDLADLRTLKDEVAKPPAPPQRQRISPAHRVRRQNALFYGGIAFTAMSLFITRRSMRRKLAQAPPPPPSATNTIVVKDVAEQAAPLQGSKADGALEAVEALGLASLNIFSFSMLFVGSVMKYFDVADVEDLRAGFRKAAGLEGDGAAVDAEADREIEMWIAETLARKDARSEGVGLREGVVERLAEMERERMEKERRR